MRGAILDTLRSAFGKKADSLSGQMDPPEYLNDSAKEFMEEDWNNGLSDKHKFEWVKDNTEILGAKQDDAKETVTTTVVEELPNKFDPLQANASDQDYRRTQAVATYLSVKRGQELIKERTGVTVNLSDVAEVDARLWRGWKSTSTGTEGHIIQLATAQELGGRERYEQAQEESIIASAKRICASIGGWEGAKALMRAKWETTQYMLDKAGIRTLQLYRGISLDQRGSKPPRRMANQRRVRVASLPTLTFHRLMFRGTVRHRPRRLCMWRMAGDVTRRAWSCVRKYPGRLLSRSRPMALMSILSMRSSSLAHLGRDGMRGAKRRPNSPTSSWQHEQNAHQKDRDRSH